MRRFKWSKFTDELLRISPRELTDDKAKVEAFNLSERIVVKKESDKIDFFISHSWEAKNPSMKCSALREFVKTLKSKKCCGKEIDPTFWFD